MILKEFLDGAGTEKNLAELILFFSREAQVGEDGISLHGQEITGR